MHPNKSASTLPSASVFEASAEPRTTTAAAAAPATAAEPGTAAAPGGLTARIHWVGGFVHHRHPADLYAEMLENRGDLVVVDSRYRETFAREHLPGAINLPWREIDESTTAHLRRDVLYVVYCWNASCHASTKTANRLIALGFQVKELHGGLETWKKQGYPTERG